jgi:succinyl-CoA:acetate CoA-transferase
MSDDTRIQGDPTIATAGEAAGLVEDGSTVLLSGFGSVGYPKAVPERLIDHEDLTVISAGSVGDEVDVDLVESGALSRRAHFQSRRPVREAINDGRIPFFDRHVSQLGDEIRFRQGIDGDVAIVEAVAVGDDWFVPSTSIGQVPAMVSAVDRLIIEVNHAQPRGLAAIHDVYERAPPPDREPIPLSGPLDRIGESRIRFDPDALEAVVEVDRPDDPYTFREPTDADRSIADHLGEFLTEELGSNPLLAETITVQFGVGSLGNALMGALSSIDVGDRELVYYGEVFQDGLLDMLEEGALAGASATSLSLSAEGQERLFDDIEKHAEDVVLRPAALSNDPGLVDRFGVVGVNSAVEVDLYGNANATHIGGTRILSGIGGGGDFVRNSRLSIVTLPSTAAGGEVSRIVPAASHVDHTEHDVSVVVTEHGVADLRGLAPRERAERLVPIADPAVRPDLKAYLERAERTGGHTPHDLTTAFDWRSGDD